jgi:hypothetical protein
MSLATNLPERLPRTVLMVADLCAPAAEPWWVISSAAVALHGAPVENVRDVDVLMSCRDAGAALERAGCAYRRRDGTRLFRSEVFGIWHEPPLPVEIFGGFEFSGREGWTRVLPTSRETVQISGRAVFIPNAAELRAMLVGFGRPKDLDRARLL